jgi:hypothetical protein
VGGYWRKGNVDVVCARYRIPQLPTLTELCDAIVTWSYAGDSSPGLFSR